MTSSDPVIVGSYNYGLVALSILIAMPASYATIDLAGPVRATYGEARLFWRMDGAIAMAIGAWARLHEEFLNHFQHLVENLKSL